MTLNRALGIVFLIVFTELIGFGLIIPVLPQLAAQYQDNHLSLGFLIASFSIAQFIASPFLGYLSDIYGRKPILVISKLGTVAAYIMLAFATNFWVFLFSRLLDGFTGGNIAVARAYIADVTTEETRSKGMAVIGISFGLGFILGPALGAFLYQGDNPQMVTAFVAAGLSLIATLFTVFYLEESTDKKNRLSSGEAFKGVLGLNNKSLWIVFLSYMFYMITFSGFESTFSLFTNQFFEFSLRQNSAVFVYAGFIGLLVQGTITRYSFKQFRLLSAVGLLLTSVGFYGMASAHSVLWLLVFLGVLSVGISFVNTFLPSLLTQVDDGKNQGVVMGCYESIGSISRVIGPLLAYSVSFQFLRGEYFAFSGVTLTVALFLYLLSKK